jgi:O-antigen biosynthesis protein
MDTAGSSTARTVVDGKGFRLGGKKFHPKGVTYGPFAPGAQDETFPDRAQAAQDFKQICELGANLLRIYHLPPPWLLDLADQHGLKLMIDIPWPKHLCFLDSPDLEHEARRAVRQAVSESRGHPAVFAYSVVNEVPAEIVRWSGPRRMQRFIEQLVAEVKEVDPACLCTFTNYPPTEFLRPEDLDFFSFNVYLHDRTQFESYLARLQMVADTKPLLLAELGMDSFREGEERKCEFLSGQIETAFRGGAAGAIVFSYTDDWYRGGEQIEDWAFGLTTRDRKPKPSFSAVQRTFRAAPYFAPPRRPKVSVVVASYNGARTLRACLESLGHLNYPDYEVVLVDDGSSDESQEIARQFPAVRTIVHSENKGLSVARNTGIAAARGEIVAFTDSDCRADEDWLHWLVSDLQKGQFVGIGGHNFLPPEDAPVAAAVMASPGGPAHVMLTDRQAEHIPGCNMAFYKWALEAISGFDPVFRQAGDDVDVCWRLQEHGHKLGFSPSGFVWHYRRSTVRAYLKQQRGYGEAEALLARKHPGYFTPVGRSIWRGRIYAPSSHGVILDRSVIYHGLFGGGFFQRLYAPEPSSALMFCTSLEYHFLVTAPLAVLAVSLPALLPVAVTSLLLSLSVCGVAGAQARVPPSRARFWSRPLVALLFFLQPIVRGLARYHASLTARSAVRPRKSKEGPVAPPVGREPIKTLAYWTQGQETRYELLRGILAGLETEGWQFRPDTGWTDYDVEIMGNRWSRVRLTTVTEELSKGRRNFRCRLVAQWSFLAKVMLGAVSGIELVVVGFLAGSHPWIWMLLLSLPLLCWLLDHAQWTLLEPLGKVVDAATARLGMIKVESREKAMP